LSADFFVFVDDTPRLPVAASQTACLPFFLNYGGPDRKDSGFLKLHCHAIISSANSLFLAEMIFQSSLVPWLKSHSWFNLLSFVF